MILRSAIKSIGIIAFALGASLVYNALINPTTSQNVEQDFGEIKEGKISGELEMQNFSFATSIDDRRDFNPNPSVFSTDSYERAMLYYEIRGIEKRQGLTEFNLSTKVTSTENETIYVFDRTLSFNIGDLEYVWLMNDLGIVRNSYEPGSYLVEINVTDMFSNKTIYYRKTFEVTE